MKFEIIAGDFPKKTEYVMLKKRPVLRLKDSGKSMLFSPVYDETPLSGQIEKVEIVTEENKKKILGSVGWGITGMLVGGLIAAPVAIAAGLAGVLKGGNKKEICIACYLKDGRKFMAIADNQIYMQLSSQAFEHSNSFNVQQSNT